MRNAGITDRNRLDVWGSSGSVMCSSNLVRCESWCESWSGSWWQWSGQPGLLEIMPLFPIMILNFSIFTAQTLRDCRKFTKSVNLESCFVKQDMKWEKTCGSGTLCFVLIKIRRLHVTKTVVFLLCFVTDNYKILENDWIFYEMVCKNARFRKFSGHRENKPLPFGMRNSTACIPEIQFRSKLYMSVFFFEYIPPQK